VGASRFKKSEGLYLYGKIRRTDWLPVDFGANKEDQEKRSALSESEESEMGDFEDYEPSEDEWDEWDLGVEEAYEEAGDADWEDSSWADLLSSARNKENDLPDDETTYAEAGDSDFEDFAWKDLLAKGAQSNQDLPSGDADSQLSDTASDDAARTGKDELSAVDEAEDMHPNAELSEDDEDAPAMHKLAIAMMEGRSLMTDLPE